MHLLKTTSIFAVLVALSLAMCAQATATTYATWLMIWYGHDQAWWNAKNPDATKNLVNGEWKTLDWSDNSQIGPYLDAIKKAGVTVVIADLTNGWGWLDTRCQLIQSECAKRGMKFCIAENSGGNTAGFEARSKDVWDRFAGPDAPYHDTYFHYRGKPLIVCYAVRDWYKSYLKMDTPYRSRFSLVWASGEDSCINKWGWQLEPWVGTIPSEDSMLVTSAVRWNPGDGALWRKSIAFLDYNFALAKKSNPKYVVVGSYDDPTERSNWLISDTAHCELGRQIRDKSGALNPSAYYERVTQWIKGKPEVEPGGLLRDGAYRIVSRASGKHLGIENTEKLSHGAVGARLIETAPAKAPFGLFWIYHLGRNNYRIIPVHSGLALEASDAAEGLGVVQDWDTTDANQRWTLSKTRDGCFSLKNNATGKALGSSQWQFKPVLTL